MYEIFFRGTLILQILAFSILIYHMVVSFFGLYKKKDKNNFDDIADKRFALIVAAHNEEVVIEQVVESLRKLEYKKELYDIFVIADNCDDNTAKIARKAGAYVCERFDSSKRGKGYALEWMFSKIFKMDKKYDAVVVFDADNLASKNFLTAMNRKLKEGYKVVQGYLDSKNPNDSWITQAYSIAFWSNNRLFQLARNNLGLSNQIGGTGFCIDLDTLEDLGWGATCLTEDLEFTCKLVINGHRVGWAHDAVIYDEKPIKLKQSWLQRKRWMQGFADVASRFFFKLLKKAVKERSWVAFDCALYTIQPYVILLSGVCVILTYFQMYLGGYIATIVYIFGAHIIIFQAFTIFQFLFTPLVMLIEKKLKLRMFIYFVVYSSNMAIFSVIYKYLLALPRYQNHNADLELMLLMIGCNILFLLICTLLVFLIDGKHNVKLFVWYLVYAIYILTWVPITIHAIANKNNKEWSHTKHTRGISIGDLENVDKEITV